MLRSLRPLLDSYLQVWPGSSGTLEDKRTYMYQLMVPLWLKNSRANSHYNPFRPLLRLPVTEKVWTTWRDVYGDVSNAVLYCTLNSLVERTCLALRAGARVDDIIQVLDEVRGPAAKGRNHAELEISLRDLLVL